MIHFTPLRKRPALSALMLLILGSGFCQAQEMLTDSARKEATEWLDQYRRFWEESFGKLDLYLKDIQGKESEA